MNAKRLLSLALVALLVLSLFAGCGGKEQQTTDTPTQSPTDQATDQAAEDKDTTPDTQEAEEPSGEDVTVTMMLSGVATENDFELELLPPLIAEQFPNIDLEVTKLPDDQYYTALKTRLASGEAPDMVTIQPRYAGANGVITLAEAGYLAPLDDLKCLAFASQSGLDAFTYEGSVYAVPSNVTMLGTYYNKDMFEEHGLSIPTHWDEFIAACETLKEAGIQPIVMGDKDMYVMQFGLYQVAANVVYPTNPTFDDQLRTGETQFTDEGTWDVVLDRYTSLYENGYIDTSSLGLSAQQAMQRFIDGEAAMTFDGSFNAAALLAEGSADFERGYFPLPANDEGQQIYASMAPGGTPAVTSTSKHIAESKQILDYWLDGESDVWKAYIDSGNIIPSYGYGSEDIDPLFTEFMNLYNEGNSFYWCNQAWPAGVENEMQAKLSEWIGGQGTTVDDIVQSMQWKFEELLDS